MTNIIGRALAPVAEAFEQLGVDYFVTGALASTYHGMPRTTLDIDVVARLRPQHVGELAAALSGAYYIDAHEVHEAIECRGQCQLLHLAAVYKIDVYAVVDAFDNTMMARRLPATLAGIEQPVLLLPRRTS